MRPKIGAGGKVENSELDNPETLAADPIKVELREVVWGEKGEKKQPPLKYYRKT